MAEIFILKWLQINYIVQYLKNYNQFIILYNPYKLIILEHKIDYMFLEIRI